MEGASAETVRWDYGAAVTRSSWSGWNATSRVPSESVYVAKTTPSPIRFTVIKGSAMTPARRNVAPTPNEAGTGGVVAAAGLPVLALEEALEAELAPVLAP